MPKILFVAHGMGDNPPGWESAVTKQLNELLGSFSKFKNDDVPFTSRVVIEPLSYDAIFDKYVLKWGHERAALAEFAQGNAIQINGVLDALGSGQLPANVSSDFWETYLDAILYRGTMVSEQVQRLVSDQLRTRWSHHLAHNDTSEEVEVYILAHSLGTIVMADVLAIVGENRDGLFPGLTSKQKSIQLYMTLANVSRLGPPKLRRIDSYDTVVRPFSAPKSSNGQDQYLERFINVRHPLDPFCFWQKFSPTKWGADYEEITNLNHLHSAIPHGMSHYLAHPKVHIPFFRALFGAKSITAADETKALENFNPTPFSTACKDSMVELKDALNEMVKLPSDEDASLDQFVVRGMELAKLARRIKSECQQLPEDFLK